MKTQNNPAKNIDYSQYIGNKVNQKIDKKASKLPYSLTVFANHDAYLLKNKIGRGGFGVIKSGHPLDEKDQQVAIKIIKMTPAKYAKSLQKITNEVKINRMVYGYCEYFTRYVELPYDPNSLSEIDLKLSHDIPTALRQIYIKITNISFALQIKSFAGLSNNLKNKLKAFCHYGLKIAKKHQITRDHKELGEFIQTFENNIGYYKIYIKLRYIPGVTLNKLLKHSNNYSLTESDRIQISILLVGFLKRLHDLNIIHRDIKPSNILIYKNPKAQQWQVSIIDFGLSQINESIDFAISGTYLYLGLDSLTKINTKKRDIYALTDVIARVFDAIEPMAKKIEKKMHYNISNWKNLKPDDQEVRDILVHTEFDFTGLCETSNLKPYKNQLLKLLMQMAKQNYRLRPDVSTVLNTLKSIENDFNKNKKPTNDKENLKDTLNSLSIKC